MGEAKAKGSYKDRAQVLAALKAAVKASKAKGQGGVLCQRSPGESGIMVRKKGKSVSMEFSETLSRGALEVAFQSYLKERFGG
ncbi:MAG: hypothetical protein AAGF94_16575 [Pseudomonadota bacterium]